MLKIVLSRKPFLYFRDGQIFPKDVQELLSSPPTFCLDQSFLHSQRDWPHTCADYVPEWHDGAAAVHHLAEKYPALYLSRSSRDQHDNRCALALALQLGVPAVLDDWSIFQP